MVQLDNISKSFNGTTAINAITTTFDAGDVHGIVGLNGAGKTTFFNLLAGFITPDNGTITWNNEPLKRNMIGYLESTNFFYSRLTGSEYLGIFPQTNIQFNIEQLNSYLCLPLSELVETYSTGMKKKLALLSVLKQDKAVYLFDEPFNGLDLETNKFLEDVLIHLKAKGKTTFVSSHILEPLKIVCDRIHLLENGRFSSAYDRTGFNQLEHKLYDGIRQKTKDIIAKGL